MAPATDAQTPPIVTRAEAKAAGLKRYFTGKACKSGHYSSRLVSSKNCEGCVQQRKADNPTRAAANCAKYNALHVEKRRAYSAANLEKNAAAVRRYKAAHRSKVRAAAKEYVAANYPKISAQRVIRYAADPDKWRAKARFRAAANPELDRAKGAARRARKLNAGGKHTAADIAEVLRIQDGKCAHSWCRESLKSGYDVDHVIPLSKGGTNGRKNIQILCRTCNRRKSNKHPIVFAQQSGLLL
jgi:hypothetical protein